MQSEIIESTACESGAQYPQSRNFVNLRALLLALVCATLLAFASITGGTLWIDEGFSAWMASHHSLGGLVQTLATGDGQDLQTGGYYLYLWFWQHLFGHSEYALRAANVPFGVVLCVSLAFVSWQLWGRPAAWLCLCFSPFYLSFLNEARTYLPLMACASASISALLVYSFADDRPSDRTGTRRLPWICLGFFLAATAMDVLAVFLGPSLLVLALCARKTSERGKWWRDWRFPIFTLLPAFVLLAGMDMFAIMHGTDYSNLSPFRPAHLGLIAYEFLGFSGFGPGRNVLRLPQASHELAQHWPWLVAGVAGLCAACLAALLARLPDRRIFFALAASLGTSMICIVGVGILLHERFLPRHAAGLYPLFLFCLLALLGGRSIPLFRSRKLGAFAAIALLAGTWALSDARLRWLPEYQKEDYRQAAALVLAESRRLHADIAWSADNFTGFYYGLQLREYKVLQPALEPLGAKSRFFLSTAEVESRVSWPTVGPAYLASNWNQAILDDFVRQHRLSKTPVILALSKPDLYDQQQVLTNLIEHLGAQPQWCLNEFVIYVLYE